MGGWVSESPITHSTTTTQLHPGCGVLPVLTEDWQSVTPCLRLQGLEATGEVEKYGNGGSDEDVCVCVRVMHTCMENR